MSNTNKNGFTLVELLVAMAVASILGAIFAAAYAAQVRGSNVQEITTDMNQNARAAMEIMTQEIRMASLDPTEDANARIITANVSELSFTLDRGDGATNEPDGDTNDPNENIRYALNGAGHLGRDTGGGLQPLCRNVEVLNFVYLDEDGNPLNTLASPTVADPRDIRAIELTIVARAETESRGPLKGDYTNSETYQNLRNEDLLVNPGDGFRRIRMATTIVCRNNI